MCLVSIEMSKIAQAVLNDCEMRLDDLGCPGLCLDLPKILRNLPLDILDSGYTTIGIRAYGMIGSCANLNVPTKKLTPHVIPYCRYTRLIIFYLGSEHNIHKRPGSSVYVTRDDYLLGNLKFVPKGKKDEVFGKPISKELITEAIRNSSYYQQYLEMVARKPTTKEGGQKKTTNEVDKPKKPTLHPSAEWLFLNLPQPKGKSTTDLYIFQRRTPVTEEASTRPLAQPKDDTSANIVRDTPSPPDAETGAEAEMSDNEGDTEILNVGEEKGEDVSNTVVLEEKTVKLDEGQAGSEPDNTL
ncbi:hypothetical protein Tco_0919093 [Tanacetum coccineum]